MSQPIIGFPQYQVLSMEQRSHVLKHLRAFFPKSVGIADLEANDEDAATVAFGTSYPLKQLLESQYDIETALARAIQMHETGSANIKLLPLVTSVNALFYEGDVRSDIDIHRGCNGLLVLAKKITVSANGEHSCLVGRGGGSSGDMMDYYPPRQTLTFKPGSVCLGVSKKIQVEMGFVDTKFTCNLIQDRSISIVATLKVRPVIAPDADLTLTTYV